MYMPGTKDFAQAVIDKKYPGLTSMVMCFEDACPEEDVPAAEKNSIHVLDSLLEAEQKELEATFTSGAGAEEYNKYAANAEKIESLYTEYMLLTEEEEA